MTTPRFDKPHMILFTTIFIMIALAGFVSRVSTRAVERALLASASDLMEFRSIDYGWEFLRDRLVLGRMIGEEETIYLFNIRLFGGDHRYLLTLQDDGRPKAYASFGVGPVSPHSMRIAKVMGSYFGESLEDRTALDAYISHSILENFHSIITHEQSRKEDRNGN